MTSSSILAAGLLIFLGVAHSLIGERRILTPLFAAEWSTSSPPRAAVERILRMAWHLLSLTLLGLGLIALEREPSVVIAWTALACALLIFVMVRSHFAWPLTLLTAFALFHSNGALTDGWLRIASAAAIITMLAASALHVWWATGGTWMLDVASPPTPPGAKRSFEPGPVATLAVAVALAAFAALVAMTAFDIGPAWSSWLVIAGVVVLTIRAFGDTKVAGFTKTIRNTDFARADDQWFTPLIVFLAFGAAASVLL